MLTTPAGVPSAKHSPGRTWRRHIRIEKIARLCKDGLYSNEQIANHLNIHVQTVIAIKQTREFQSKMIELTTGVVSDLDKDLREITQNSKEELAAMIPNALLGIRDLLLSKNENIKLKACLEILDREGTNAKVSKIDVKHETFIDMSKANSAAMDIMSLLGRPVGEEQDTRIIDGFTMTASQATEQFKNMTEVIDEEMLEKLDLSKAQKQ